MIISAQATSTDEARGTSRLNPVTTGDETSEAARPTRLLAVAAGLVVGLAMCSIFALPVVFRPLPAAVFIGAPIAATLLGGAIFAALLAHPWRELGDAWPRMLGLAVVLCVASVSGLMIPLGVEPSAVLMPDSDRLLVFRLTFVMACALIAFGCTAMASLMFGARGWLGRSTVVAVVTAGAYALVLLLIEPLLGLHVGAGNQAMPKIAALTNLIAGVVGGTLAYVLLRQNTGHTAPAS